MTERLSDAAVRAAALNPAESFLISASAGSGKTELLIQRYLTLLATVDEPEQVLAITFTRKATAEMRDRILTELHAASNAPSAALPDHKQLSRKLAASVLERSHALGWDILRLPQRLTIRTIDSLCSMIARLLPVTSGIGGGCEPLDDASPLYDKAATLTLDGLYGSDAPLTIALHSLLLHRQGSLDGCRAIIAAMLPQRDEWLPHAHNLATTKDAVALHQYIARVTARVLPTAPLPTPKDADSMRHFAHILLRAAEHLRSLFVRTGQCDYAELSLAARTALQSGAGDLDVALGSRIQHLLVDEMHDTSVTQYDILERLTQSWDGHGQTIFLVGDHKQSIYLFRQARVERFLATRDSGHLGSVPLTHLELTRNFRSHPMLVAGFNNLFESVRPDILDDGDSGSFTPAETGRSTTFDAPAAPRIHWHPLPASGYIDAEAEQVVEIVQQEIANHPLNLTAERPPIAVLVRVRHHAASIASALRHANISFRASDIESLGSLPEVIDALSLLRALLHTADRTAWLSVLRAPWCGLTLADLNTLAAGDISRKTTIPTLVSERLQALSDDGRIRAAHTLAILNAALAQRGRLPAADWLRGTWNSLGAPRFLTPQQRANVHEFFLLVAECDQQNILHDASALEDCLGKLTSSDIPTVGCAVEIMSIHKAKGLEWQTVILPRLHAQTRRDDTRLLQLHHHEEATLFAPAPPSGEQSDGTTYQHLRDAAHAARLRELRRLLYVGVTRARERVHLLAAIPVSKGKLAAPRTDSLLASAWPAAQPHFQQAHDGLSRLPAVAAVAAPSNVVAFPVAHTVTRLPIASIFSLARELRPAPQSLDAARPAYERSEGSVGVRALGTAVHEMLQQLATELAAGSTPASLLASLDTRRTAILALLRAAGLSSSDATRRAAQAHTALRSTLEDPEGLWLLSPHPQAASELAFTVLNSEGLPATYRMDRCFHAGSAPLAPGCDTVWISDYKVSTREDDNPEFREAETQKHFGQLQFYARLQQPALAGDAAIKLAVYYPLRKKNRLVVRDYAPAV